MKGGHRGPDPPFSLMKNQVLITKLAVKQSSSQKMCKKGERTSRQSSSSVQNDPQFGTLFSIMTLLTDWNGLKLDENGSRHIIFNQIF